MNERPKVEPCPECGAIPRENTSAVSIECVGCSHAEEVGKMNPAVYGTNQNAVRTMWNAFHLRGQLESLTARNRRLEGALEPFAKLADVMKHREDTHQLYGYHGGGGSASITVADLRAARAALSEPVEGGEA